ncbi:MAG TPA: nucleotidyltransferase [Candidatus Desulfofervidus auxilii]|uniref:Nucleotidyltransferase n=1 Tax=Desulfofervidus auxilii TaxID=1621989 RepID=A0A7C1VP82_DESA2|nr:nucleotidyltransferase [Candidatus Desulfofervidus auxilii]
MKKLEQITAMLKAHKEELKQKYGVKEIGIFGSYVRGEQKPLSDVDILVEFEKGTKIGLLKFINLENYLSEVLGVKVDLVTKSALKPRIGKYILREVVYV